MKQKYDILCPLNKFQGGFLWKDYELNKNLAQMLKGGVIMDVVTCRAGNNCRKSRCICSNGIRESTLRY